MSVLDSVVAAADGDTSGDCSTTFADGDAIGTSLTAAESDGAAETEVDCEEPLEGVRDGDTGARVLLRVALFVPAAGAGEDVRELVTAAGAGDVVRDLVAARGAADLVREGDGAFDLVREADATASSRRAMAWRIKAGSVPASNESTLNCVSALKLSAGRPTENTSVVTSNGSSTHWCA